VLQQLTPQRLQPGSRTGEAHHCHVKLKLRPQSGRGAAAPTLLRQRRGFSVGGGREDVGAVHGGGWGVGRCSAGQSSRMCRWTAGFSCSSCSPSPCCRACVCVPTRPCLCSNIYVCLFAGRAWKREGSWRQSQVSLCVAVALLDRRGRTSL